MKCVINPSLKIFAGFPLCNVFELADDDPNKYLPADEIEKYLGKEVNVLGYMITNKPVQP